jgi:MOSC domain-containing protein YiiM
MRVVSVNVGLPKAVTWRGKTVTTGIFKRPVIAAVMVRTLNLDGDKQADLSVHGGVSKAVYAYPAEHYDFWAKELPDLKFSYGMFGENLTTEGLLETETSIGDRFRVGGCELVVTEPRMPCYKLGIRFERPDIVKRFLDSRLTGIYFAVLEEGEINAGDSIELLTQHKNGVRVDDITRLYAGDIGDSNMLRRAAELEALPEKWREYFRHKLEKNTRAAHISPTPG